MPYPKFVVCELSANGFGSPETLINERVDLVLAAYDYLKFKFKYEYECYKIGEKCS